MEFSTSTTSLNAMESAPTAGLSSPAFHIGLLGIPLALGVASVCRLEDGRWIGPVFIEGSRAMLHQLLGVYEDGCGHCHEKPCGERP